MRYSIHITNICNLRCTYCYEDDKDSPGRTNFVISKDEIDKRYREILQQANCTDIELLGGEVFLYENLLEYIFEKYHDLFPLLITTNGTINNKHITELISKYKPHIGVSLDDPLNIEKTRVGINFKEALTNALKWRELTNVSINCVLTPHNLERIKETFDFYVIEHGFKTIHFGCVEEWLNDHYWQKYIKSVKRFVEETDSSILKETMTSPWKYYSAVVKEFIYENGIEKVEIFNNKQVVLSPYQRAKHAGHVEYCQKIGIKPTPLVPEGVKEKVWK